MRSRGLVVAIAVVLAVAAAAAVILYTQGVKDEALGGGGVTVIVANQDIAPNTQLQPPVDQVQVFATYQSVSVIPVPLQQYIRQPASATTAAQKQLPPFTLTLIPDVKVLK